MTTLTISASTRRQLTALRDRAMAGGADAALAELPTLPAAASVEDKVATASLRAELLHLDYREDDALAVFDSDIEPLLPTLSPVIRVEALENKSSVLMAAFKGDGADLYYQLVDRRSLLEHPTRDYRRIVAAADAAERGEHYEALPDYWAELRQAYGALSWRRRAYAHGDFGRECLALGWMPQAAYHFVLAERGDRVDQLADALVRRNDASVVSAVVRQGLRRCALQRHAVHFARFIIKGADLLPDADLAATLDRLGALDALCIGHG
jgi:hypothetical protein